MDLTTLIEKLRVLGDQYQDGKIVGLGRWIMMKIDPTVQDNGVNLLMGAGVSLFTIAFIFLVIRTIVDGVTLKSETVNLV